MVDPEKTTTIVYCESRLFNEINQRMIRVQYLTLLLFIALVPVASADISLPKIFSDHMVLQDSRQITIWGTADPSESLEISLGESSTRLAADDKGNWAVRIDRPKGDGPFDLTIAGKTSRIVITDILLGQVWLCSGQSNMNWPLNKTEKHQPEIENSTNKQIRLFKVPREAIDKPQNDILKEAKWVECKPDTSKDFSAVAYYFGKKLQSELKCPIGLVQSAWGGTPAESWTSRKSLSAITSLKPLLEHWDSRTEQLKNPQRPGNLYNGMIAPLIRFKFAGVIWYQGEANVGRGYQYATLFPAMINCWRKSFGDDKLPFYFVNLAPYRYQRATPEALPEVWDAQLKTLKLQKTGMAVISDIGNIKDIHPKNKKGVGERLALWALAKNHDKKNIVFSGPLFKQAEIEGNRIRVRFTNGKGLKSRDGEPLTDFLIAGSDRKFVKAVAVIDDDSLLISAESVKTPRVVRFAWTDTATPNLVNEAGLPAAPFRSDDFELKSKDKHFR